MAYTDVITDNIYFVISVNQAGNNHTRNMARNSELERILFECGMSRHAMKINEDVRVCQSYRKFATGATERSLEYNILFGQSLAKAFETEVWLCHNDENYLLTQYFAKKVDGKFDDLDRAIRHIVNGEINTKREICDYPAFTGSFAEVGRGRMSMSLKKFNLDGIAKEVELALQCYYEDDDTDEFDQLSQIVKQEIVATMK